MRDESLLLKNDEVTGDIPKEVQFEDLSLINHELEDRISDMLLRHKKQGTHIDLADLLQDFLAEHPRAHHFDVARIVIDQAVRLGYSQSDLYAIQPDWKAINHYGAKVQANVIDKY